MKGIFMQNRTHPLVQILALLVLPMLVLTLINYVFATFGRNENSDFLQATLKMSIFVIPNSLFIILHKYKVSYLGFLVAFISAYLAVHSLSAEQVELFSKFSLYLVNIIYFIFLIGITYLAYFVISGFKLKNIIFIIGGLIAHIFSFIGLFSINKIALDRLIIRDIMMRGINLYLLIGLALGIGLLFFPLADKEKVSYSPSDEDEL